MQATPIAIVLASVILSAAILAATLTVIIPAPYGYVEKDRWTGRVIACEIDTPFPREPIDITCVDTGKEATPR